MYAKKIYGSHNTADEAIEKMAAEKKISTKINYDVLKNLGFGSPKPAPVSHDESPSMTEDSKPTPPSYPSLKRFQTPVESVAKKKKFKVEKKPNLLPRSTQRNQSLTQPDLVPHENINPVIESGPVEPDEDDLSDLSDDEEPLQSAADLLCQQFGGGDEGWGEEEFD